MLYIPCYFLDGIRDHRSMTFECRKTRPRRRMIPVCGMTPIRACVESESCECSHPNLQTRTQWVRKAELPARGHTATGGSAGQGLLLSSMVPCENDSLYHSLGCQGRGR